MPGVQSDCRVRALRYQGDPAAALLDACASDTPASGELPCWQLVSPSDRCAEEAPIELVVRRAAPATGSTLIEVRCNDNPA